MTDDDRKRVEGWWLVLWAVTFITLDVTLILILVLMARVNEMLALLKAR